jgi:protein-S-isoprenylcysteine O-methyltransferase Ste14
MLSLALLTVLFYATHSALAAPAMKRWGQRWLGRAHHYRLFYSLVSTVQFSAVALVWWRLPKAELFQAGAVTTAVGGLFIAAGTLIIGAAVGRFGVAGFLGLRPERDTGLVRTGLHHWVRHPIYSGIVLALIGWCLLSPCWPTLLVAGLTALYLPIGIHLEERKLIAAFGDAYRRYRREVPALLPKLHG